MYVRNIPSNFIFFSAKENTPVKNDSHSRLACPTVPLSQPFFHFKTHTPVVQANVCHRSKPWELGFNYEQLLKSEVGKKRTEANEELKKKYKKRNSAVLHVSSLVVTSNPHAMKGSWSFLVPAVIKSPTINTEWWIQNDGKTEVKQRKENSTSTGIS
jgi:hypothetical protein